MSNYQTKEDRALQELIGHTVSHLWVDAEKQHYLKIEYDGGKMVFEAEGD